MVVGGVQVPTLLMTENGAPSSHSQPIDGTKEPTYSRMAFSGGIMALYSHTRRAAFAAVLVVSLLVAMASPGWAEAGDLDPTFGHKGIVVTPGLGGIFAIALQPDGKIVAAGTSTRHPTFSVANFTVVRYEADGTLDRGFGGGGIVITRVGERTSWARAVALQADGKIVVAGVALAPNGVEGDVALARYNPNGSLDPGFGEGGRVITSFPSGASGAWGVAVQADGRIVAGGAASAREDIYTPDFALARYTAGGSLDASFGDGGLKVTRFPGGSSYGRALVIQPDGRIVLAGGTDPGRFALARYEPDGRLDQGFGAEGRVSQDIDGDLEGARAVALQPDGKIVAAGGALAPGGENAFALARFDPTGQPDPRFGGDGDVLSVLPGGGGAAGVAIQADGKIVVAGQANGDLIESTADFALGRYLPDGRLDPGFGDGGIVITSLGSRIDVAFDVAIQPDGRIVAAGRASGNASGTRSGFGLVGYLGT